MVPNVQGKLGPNPSLYDWLEKGLIQRPCSPPLAVAIGLKMTGAADINRRQPLISKITPKGIYQTGTS